MNSLPKPISDLIELLEDLPGVGPRSASRLAFYLLRAPESFSNKMSKALGQIHSQITICENCYNYSDKQICEVCSNSSRERSIFMVVEDPLDVVAFERSGNFKGIYHVLGGVISPINGIGPDEIRIVELIERVKKNPPEEIIIATNPNLEGESTALYIKKEISAIQSEIKISRLARGLPTGADLDYADDTTLLRALEGRTDM